MSTSSNLRQLARTLYEDQMEGPEMFSIHELIDQMCDLHPETVKLESEALIRTALYKIFKAILAEGINSDQKTLPGLRLPIALMVRGNDGEIRYISSTKARWEHLTAALFEREANSEACLRRLDQMRNVVEMLRPVLASNPEMTVADGLRLMQERAA